MALNKYMHPRNLYKNPPDFAKLANSFAEFSSIAKTDVTGKVIIDFKDPHSLRVLTTCLLKLDFGLDVNIPEDRLVPTLPLRLNYILWIEDLLNAVGRKENVRGLDIGTGACAIYPLLAVTKNKWHMVGTESDEESLLKAQENVMRNNLQNFIKLNKNSTATLLEHLVTEKEMQNFDFCMCNPPFYSSVEELCESRSPARLPPKNGFTGSPQELITDGGELTFCRKIIKESKICKDNVLIFSTMVGHKYNLKELVQDLKADGITHTTTEFCQGRVTRWGLAWTYQNFDIAKLVPGRDKLRKKCVPLLHVLPMLNDSPYDIQTVSTKLLDMLKVLNIGYKILNKKGNQLYLDVTATENTWSNQRRKRRLMKLQQDDSKKPKFNEDTLVSASDSKNITEGDCGKVISVEHNVNNNQDTSSNEIDNTHCKILNKSEEAGVQFYQKTVDYPGNTLRTSDYDSECSVVKSAESEALVHALFKVFKKEHNLILEIEFIDGTSGKEGVHQIMQYIKNNWK